MKVVIIGGVAGGATAAARIRRLDENAEIIVLERSGYVSYANCGLPYYIGDVITDKEELTLQSPESLFNRYRIDVRVNNEVLAIDKENKTVTVQNNITNEQYTETYDKLILSPGARAIRPDLPGIDNEKIFTLRTVEDTFKIKEFVNENKPKSVAVIGGGFIGLEMAENLFDLGISVTIMQRPKQLLNILDYDMSCIVHNKLRKKGINVILSADVTGFKEENNKLSVCIKDKDSVIADFVILAIGVTPDNNLAKDAGLLLGMKGAIVVDDHMLTSDKDIYAVGDAVVIKHKVLGNDAVIALAGPANKQGRIAADNICDIKSSYKGSLGSSIIKLFDTTIASTGVTEKLAKQSEIDCDSIVLTPSSHASYYPDSFPMTMKIVFEKNTFRLLGAQIIGKDGVDKRIDVLATAICFGACADELKNLDLCYAPPYSSAKDPVNMAGFIAENLSYGLIEQYSWEDIEELLKKKDITLLDTRTNKEYSKGHIEGYINIPVDELRDNLDKLDINKPVYVMCQSGLRSYLSCRILTQKGFTCYNFKGGYGFYKSVALDLCISEKTYPCGMEK